MSAELLDRMVRKIRQYQAVGCEVEAFLAGRDTIARLDEEFDKNATLYRAQTKGRRHREVLGVVVILCRTARAEGLEIVLRRESGPATVERLR